MFHFVSSSFSHFVGMVHQWVTIIVLQSVTLLEWFISESLIVRHLFVYLQELLKINYKTDLFKQLVVWLVTYSKACFQLSANWDRRFGILCHEFGHPPVTSLLDEKKREPTHWSRLGYWTTTALEKWGCCWNTEVEVSTAVARATYAASCLQVFRNSTTQCWDSCIPYTSLFVIRLPFGETQFSISSLERVNY
jgi:hypothetical protein